MLSVSEQNTPYVCCDLLRMKFELCYILLLLALTHYCSAFDWYFGIWPGTKWCGLGNHSTSIDDLAEGNYHQTDKCCRTHDQCDKKIYPYRYKWGALNWNLVTMVECRCDKLFWDCLKTEGRSDKVANGVGTFYFGALKKKCFVYNSSGGRSNIYRTPEWTSSQWSLKVDGVFG